MSIDLVVSVGDALTLRVFKLLTLPKQQLPFRYVMCPIPIIFHNLTYAICHISAFTGLKARKHQSHKSPILKEISYIAHNCYILRKKSEECSKIFRSLGSTTEITCHIYNPIH